MKSSLGHTHTHTHTHTHIHVSLLFVFPNFGCLTTSEAEGRWQHPIITDLWNESINVHLKLISLLTHTHTEPGWREILLSFGYQRRSWKVHLYVHRERVSGRWKLVIWAVIFLSLMVTNTEALRCCDLNNHVSTHITCNTFTHNFEIKIHPSLKRLHFTYICTNTCI